MVTVDVPCIVITAERESSSLSSNLSLLHDIDMQGLKPTTPDERNKIISQVKH